MPTTTRLSLSVAATAMGFAALVAAADPLPPSATYRPLPTLPFDVVKANDEAEKPRVMQDQQTVLNQRYDLSNNPIPGVTMSGGRKPVQGGVRVKLPAGVSWDTLASTSPDEIRRRGLLPPGFMPLPHVKQATGGQVIPNTQIDEIRTQEGRNLRRFDVDFDLPDTITPEFPPPIFLALRAAENFQREELTPYQRWQTVEELARVNPAWTNAELFKSPKPPACTSFAPERRIIVCSYAWIILSLGRPSKHRSSGSTRGMKRTGDQPCSCPWSALHAAPSAWACSWAWSWP